MIDARLRKENMDDQRKNIFLIGFMGVGKSTVAELLCEKTGAAYVEMDQVIAISCCSTIT